MSAKRTIIIGLLFIFANSSFAKQQKVPYTISDNYNPYSSNSVYLSDFYPNPASNEATIELQIPDNKILTSIIVYNTLGQTVQVLADGAIETNTILVDISSWLPGLYICRMIYNGQQKVKKLIVIR